MNILKPINPYAFKNTSGENSTVNHKAKSIAHSSEKSSASKPAQDKKDAVSDVEKEKIEHTEISKFIGLIVKLENGIEKGILSDRDTLKIMMLFEEKIDSMPPKDRKKLEKTLAYREMQLDPDDGFSQQAADKIMRGSELDQHTVFNFLKSREFIALIKDEAITPPTFNPKDMKLMGATVST